jgi:hypothetical protein
MKQITIETTLKQGDKTYRPIEIDGVFYWVDPTSRIEETYPQIVVEKLDKMRCYTLFQIDNINDIDYMNQSIVIAQSQPKIERVPVIDLYNYIGIQAINQSKKFASKNGETNYILGFINGHQLNQNQYTQKDIDRAIELAREQFDFDGYSLGENSKKEILEDINSISLIEVDEHFNIISYE